MKKFLIPLLFLSACADLGPAVPSQAGMSLADARQAYYACLPNAPRAGQNAVVGSYVSGVLFGGVLLGPIAVAANEKQIRYNGEANGVDRCLSKRGFKRRVLTKQEVATINASSHTTRVRLLNHFVAGGTLANFS
ncbi:hypothetical protein [Litoreibacter albidus]|uniref:hypothetical protein n=1 Tax=Litoreibacter albidus TaxID=670155 RepID=UPI0037350DAA